MTKITQKLALAFLLIALVLAAGCQGQEAPGPEDLNPGQDQEQDQEGEEGAASIRTDMIGRAVFLPDQIDSVYSMGPMENIVLYTIDPDYLAGWNYELNDYEAYYIGEPYASLPVLGGWLGKNGTGNIEEIVKADPDLIIGTARDDSQDSLDHAARIQEQTGIPVYMLVKEELADLPAMYADLASLLGEVERAAELIPYIEETLAKAEEARDQLEEKDKVRLYYAEGEDGLQSETRGSSHGEVIDLVGALNVVEAEEAGDYGRVSISIEQLISWDPEVIITDEEKAFYDKVMDLPLWQEIDAVKKGQVLGIPHRPYFWIDRPASANQILGVRWLGHALYPELFDYDMETEIKDFFSLFYHYDLNEEELAFFLS